MWTSSIFFYHVSFLDQFLSMSVFPLYTFHQAWWPTIMRFYFAFLLGKTTDGSLITRAIAIAVKLKKLAAREIEMLQSWRLAGWCPKHSIKWLILLMFRITFIKAFFKCFCICHCPSVGQHTPLFSLVIQKLRIGESVSEWRFHWLSCP